MVTLRRKLKRIWRTLRPHELGPEDELVAVDLETSTLDPKTASILSIGAVPIRGQRIVLSESFSRTVRSTAPVDREAVKYHRMRPVDVAQGDPAGEVVAEFVSWLGDRPLIAYCIGFDTAVLDRVLHENGQDGLECAQIDLRDVYRREISKRNPDHAPQLSMDHILAHLRVPVIGRHTALGDATAVAVAYLALKRGATWSSPASDSYSSTEKSRARPYS